MANFFSLQDGNLTDASVYGYSLTGAEVMNNATGVWLSTVDSYGPVFLGDSGILSAVAIHLSAANANPLSSTLTLKISTNIGGGTIPITQTYAISSFTQYDGSNNLITNYPQNWQILKLTNPYTLINLSSFRVSLNTSTSGTLAVMCSASNNNYNKSILKTNNTTPTSADNIHIGSSLIGLTIEPRTITTTTSTFQNLYVHNQGTLTFPLTSSKILTLIGSAGLQITSDGTLNIGTSSSSIPLSTTHTLALSTCIIHNGGNLNVYGGYKTPYEYLKYNVNSGTNQFVLNNSLSSNWLSGDSLSFTPNITGSNTTDFLKLSTFISGDIFKTNTNSTYNYNSISSNPYIPTVSNITRNVTLSGIGSIDTKFNSNGSAKVNINNTSFNNIATPLYHTLSSNGYANLNGNVFNNTVNYFGRLAEYSVTTSATSYIRTDFDTNTIFAGVFTWEFFAYGGFNCNDFYHEGPTQSGWGFNGSVGGQITWAIHNGANIIKSTSILPANRWNHIAVTRDSGNNLRLYINGTLDALSSNSSGITGASNGSRGRLLIGASNVDGTYNITKNIVSNMRMIKNQSLYNTASFTVPKSKLTLASQGVIAANIYFLAFGTSNIIDESPFNNSITLTPPVSSYIDSNPFLESTISTNNINLSGNIFINPKFHGLYIGFNNLNNCNIINNLILSSYTVPVGFYPNTSIITGVKFEYLSVNNCNIDSNYIIATSGYGSYASNVSSYDNSVLGVLSFKSNSAGALLTGSNIGVFSLNSIYGKQEGVYVDASTSTLSGVTFKNILANNNSSVGFKVSGNNLNYLTPVVLNINGLTASNNTNAGFEAYNITGNLSSIISNNNLSASRISIGNGPTIFDGISSTLSGNCLNILSAINYNQTIIKNALLSSLSLNSIALNISSNKLEEFRLENSTLSATTPLQISSSRSKLEGSYIFHNCNSNIYGLSSLALTGYQTDGYKEGIIVMAENGLSGNHYKYTGAGAITLDTIEIHTPNTVSERLTPWSTTTKLRSTSKLVPMNIGDYITIQVILKRSTNYTGSTPRLMMVGNASMGYTDMVLATSVLPNGSWETLSYSSLPSADVNGVVEFYVDCSGNNGSGYINIDSWNFY